VHADKANKTKGDKREIRCLRGILRFLKSYLIGRKDQRVFVLVSD
jgi:hypothetical protein